MTNHRRLAKYLQEKWQAVFQIQVHLHIQKCNHFYRGIEQGDFHIGGFFKNLFYFDLFPFFESFSRKTNHSRWNCPEEYHTVINLLRQVNSDKERENLMAKAEQLLLSYAPVVPLLKFTHHYSHRPDLQDYVIHQDGCIDFRFASLK